MNRATATRRNIKRLVSEREPFSYGKSGFYGGFFVKGQDDIERFCVDCWHVRRILLVYEQGHWFRCSDADLKGVKYERGIRWWLAHMQPDRPMRRRSQSALQQILKGSPEVARLLKVSLDK